ncbi:hypothetical protein EMIT0324P_20218 [Pseudomonas chlororaphis]
MPDPGLALRQQAAVPGALSQAPTLLGGLAQGLAGPLHSQ